MSNTPNLLDRLRRAVDRERSRPDDEAAAAAAAEAERLAAYPPEVVAAAELLGQPPEEVAEVHTLDGDLWIATTNSPVRMVYVDAGHPDGAGLDGLMLAEPIRGDWQFLPPAMPVFTPRTTPAVEVVEDQADDDVDEDQVHPEPWRADPRLTVMVAELDRARAWLSSAGESEVAYAREAVDALELSVARIEAELRGAWVDAHPAAPSADEIADRVAVLGWAVDVLTAGTDREVEAARSTWGARRAVVFGLPPHAASGELAATVQWFDQHHEHAAMWADVDLGRARRVLAAVEARGPQNFMLVTDRTQLPPPVVIEEPAAGPVPAEAQGWLVHDVAPGR